VRLGVVDVDLGHEANGTVTSFSVKVGRAWFQGSCTTSSWAGAR
jgi:hypothetical protein